MNRFLRFVLLFSIFGKILAQTCTSGQGSAAVIYVTPGGTGTTCSFAAPCSLQQAISSNLNTNGKNVIWLYGGTYSLTSLVSISTSNFYIEGGFTLITNNQNPNYGAIQWSKETGVTSSIVLDVSTISSQNYYGIQFINSNNFYLLDLSIVVKGSLSSSTNYGQNIYGLIITGSSNYLISRTSISTTNAGNGAIGYAGSTGPNGSPGNNAPCSAYSANYGGAGGNGAYGGSGAPQTPSGDSYPGANGGYSYNSNGGGGGGGGGNGAGLSNSGSGGSGGGVNGGGGGGGGGPSTYSGSTYSGNNGGNGGNGGTGYTPPQASLPSSVWGTSFFQPPSSSYPQSGGLGYGGGGGGGGSGGGSSVNSYCSYTYCCGFFCWSSCCGQYVDYVQDAGGPGGGGGGGGAGGTGGSGGWGGGGNFGIYQYQITSYTIVDSVFSIGAPGTGGPGGPGGYGGNGGSGGAGCYNQYTQGGNGGNGGNGGQGGTGAQGPNGASAQLVTISTGGGGYNAANPSTSIPTPPVQVSATHFLCSHSEIQLIQGGSYNWGFGSNGLFAPTSFTQQGSVYSQNAQNPIIYFTTTGLQDLTLNGVTLHNFINIQYNRGYDAIVNSATNATSSVFCVGSSTTSATFNLVKAANLSPTPGISFTFNLYRYTTPPTGTYPPSLFQPTSSGNSVTLSFGTGVGYPIQTGFGSSYLLSGQATTSCCGNGVMAYHTFSVFDPSQTNFNLPIGEGGIAGEYCPTYGIFNLQPNPPADISFATIPASNAISVQTSINGITSSFLDPTKLNPAQNYTITMTANTACSSTVTVTKYVYIYQVNPVNISGLASFYCTNSSAAVLTLNPSGGQVTGPGIVIKQGEVYFDPSTVSPGTYTITYQYIYPVTNCPTSVSYNVTVYTTTNVFFSGLNQSNYCLNDPSIDLLGSRSDGIFSPNLGLSSTSYQTVFTPYKAGVGVQNITFSVNDGGSACADEVYTKLITIFPLPTVYNITISPTIMCLNYGLVQLEGYPSGGVFSGPGVSGSKFDPSLAGSGFHNINYTTTNSTTTCHNSVTTTAQVLPLLNADFYLPNFVCQLAPPPPNIYAYFPGTNQTNFNGNFTGEGISNIPGANPITGAFNFSGVHVGTKSVTLAVTGNDGCTTYVTKQYALFDTVSLALLPPPGLNFSQFSIPAANSNYSVDYWICYNQPPVIISYFPTYAGTFTLGPGNGSLLNVNGTYYFDPSQNRLGYHTLAFQLIGSNDPQCNSSIMTTIYVKPLEVLKITWTGGDATNVNGTFCENQPPITLVGTPSGGSWNGTGVIGNIFYPDLAGQGLHNITYTRLSPANSPSAGCWSETGVEFDVILTYDCNRYNIVASPPPVNLTWLWAVIAVLLCIVITCAVIIVIIVIRKRRITREALMKEIELRKFDETFVDDIIANSTQYQKIPGIKMSSSKLQSVLGGGEEGMNWEIKLQEIDIVKEIGRGAYGIVYLGRWREEQVAVKKIIGDGGSAVPEEVIDTFASEIKLMKNLRPHPHVVTMLGVVSDPLCIVTKFYENGSLIDLLNSEHKMSMSVNITIMKGIASGMLHLHKEGIIHRDLAARNVLLDKDYEPIISDFGLSRVVGVANQSAVTKSDVGPIKWMPPESLVNKTYGTKSDVWAFGVTCWEILARSEPYPDMEPLEVAFKVVQEGLRLTLPSNCSPEIAEIILSCWAHNKEDRPDFSQLFAQLSQLSI